jgi:hypothetical protein
MNRHDDANGALTAGVQSSSLAVPQQLTSSSGFSTFPALTKHLS